MPSRVHHRSAPAAPAQAAAPKAPIVAAGIVRKGQRTKTLVKRIAAGDIVLIDHADIDGIAAEALIERRPAAILDAAAPVTGRYPNRGPRMIADAGIPLYALADAAVFDVLVDGAPACIRADGVIEQNGLCIPAAADRWDRDRIDRAIARARENLASELQRFAANTLQFVAQEAQTLLEPVELPPLKGVPPIAGRHVVIVVRGEGYREDLASIRGYLADVRPVVIGVDGGADALVDVGIRPDIILGDMDSVSDAALGCGARLVVHAYASTGDAPGLARVSDAGLDAEAFRVPGTSEDAAMRLAYEKGAELIVAVGSHSSLEDFLDKGRAGMASTFVTRLRVGARLVNARGVSKLHQRRPSIAEMAALVLSAGFVLVTVVTQSEVGRNGLRLGRLWLRLTLVHFQHLLWRLHGH